MDRLRVFHRSWFVITAYLILSLIILGEAIELLTSKETVESYEIIFDIKVSKTVKIIERIFIGTIFMLGGIHSFQERKNAKTKA